jgi:hypothetical protein
MLIKGRRRTATNSIIRKAIVGYVCGRVSGR